DLLSKLNGLDDDELRRELNKPRPSMPYVAIPWKLLSGKRIYRDEWASLFVQATKDAVKVGMMCYGVPPQVVDAFGARYDSGRGAVTEVEQKALEWIRNQGAKPEDRDAIIRRFGTPAQYTVAFKSVLLEVHRSVKPAPLHKTEQRFADLSVSIAFFRG